MTQIKKDSKIIIKVQKLGVLLGSGDISLFQSINSKEKVINKWVNLSRTDIKKSAMMSNTVNNIMKINLKISISYIGNFNSTQCNDDSPSKKELVTKIKNPIKNNIITKNKKVNLSSKRTNSVNNNNSLFFQIFFLVKNIINQKLMFIFFANITNQKLMFISLNKIEKLYV